MRRQCFALLVFCFMPLSLASSLEWADNVSKIIFHEKESVFSFFYQKEGHLLSLLDNQDEKTSFMSLLLNDREYLLEDNAFFNQYTEEISRGIRVHWNNNGIHVSMEIIAAPEISGFKVKLMLRNLSKEKLSAGFKYLMDTFDNGKNITFLSRNGETIKRERAWFSPEIPASWGSQPESPGILPLTIIPDKEKKPDMVVFANWKRLSDSGWNFKISEGRSFTLLPYSINDSAMAILFTPREIPPGEVRSISFRISSRLADKTKMVIHEDKKTEKKSYRKKIAKQKEPDLLKNYSREYELEQKENMMKEIEALLGEINHLLAGDSLSCGPRIQELEKELNRLKTSRNEDIR